MLSPGLKNSVNSQLVTTCKRLLIALHCFTHLKKTASVFSGGGGVVGCAFSCFWMSAMIFKISGFSLWNCVACVLARFDSRTYRKKQEIRQLVSANRIRWNQSCIELKKFTWSSFELTFDSSLKFPYLPLMWGRNERNFKLELKVSNCPKSWLWPNSEKVFA